MRTQETAAQTFARWQAQQGRPFTLPEILEAMADCRAEIRWLRQKVRDGAGGEVALARELDLLSVLETARLVTELGGSALDVVTRPATHPEA